METHQLYICNKIVKQANDRLVLLLSVFLSLRGRFSARVLEMVGLAQAQRTSIRKAS